MTDATFPANAWYAAAWSHELRPLIYDRAMQNMRSGGDLPDAVWPEPTPPTLDDLLRDPPDIDQLLAEMSGNGPSALHG